MCPIFGGVLNAGSSRKRKLQRGIELASSQLSDTHKKIHTDQYEEALGGKVIFSSNKFSSEIEQRQYHLEELKYIPPSKKTKHGTPALILRGEIKAVIDLEGDDIISQYGETPEQLDGNWLFPMVLGFRGTSTQE
eukprot:Gregarina_sp_Poly_1__9844@NODE_634_length_7031_cov_50_167289_g484_i0_p4_GENE_NODE_634_length_7031_cov_50_167289_g484_i0NODE_634_length_7031_cov_50_167289_g484_i0_p4_ORF_typecomplete_len135_score21_67_NODE_634_length_7031_cov_50_167289_g484_i040214425